LWAAANREVMKDRADVSKLVFLVYILQWQ